MDENGHTTGPSTTYTVVKQPRWFETWTAYIAYAVMLLLLCVCGFRLYAKHLHKKNAQLLREEIARTKLEYFTNVSHELLTPLTVLSCLTDEIEQNNPSGSPITRGLRDNILRLKRLIRQVLDFRKAEQKSLSLQASYGDVAAFIRHIAQTDFTLLARKKRLTLTWTFALRKFTDSTMRTNWKKWYSIFFPMPSNTHHPTITSAYGYVLQRKTMANTYG